MKAPTEREKWLAERKKGLGGSDIGAIFNLDYGCSRALAYDKTNVPEDFPESLEEQNANFERGNLMEPVIRELYQIKTGRPTKPLSEKIIRHPGHPHMQVSLDAVTEDAFKVGKGYAEFKCVSYFVMRQFEKEGVRRGYILQMQQGLFVSGFTWGSFGILCLDPWKFRYFDVEQDYSLQEMLIQAEADWWHQVFDLGILPDPLEDPEDKRCRNCRWRRTCRGGEYSLAPTSGDERRLIHTPELAPLVSQWVDLDQLCKAAENQIEPIKEALRLAIGANDGLTVPGAKVLMPRWDETRWETKQLNALLPALRQVIGECQENQMDPDIFIEACNRLLNLCEAISVARKTSPKSSIRYYPWEQE